MVDLERQEREPISLFTWATALLRYRWRIVRSVLVGGTMAAILVFLKPALYVASASFVPQGTDVSRSGLAGLAGQLGVTVPAMNQSLSPEFYAKVLTSRVLLTGIVRGTFVVPEQNGRRIAFLDLFDVDGAPLKLREEKGTKLLTKMITTNVVKPTGVVELSVATKWPSVSLAIVSALVNGVNDFNQKTRQGQAAAERKFIEARLAVAAADLRASEDRLESFLRNNRQFASSPELTFQRERLQRDVNLQQQVFTSLTQSYEEVRIREVRDTPVITVIESPAVDALPKPRGRGVGILVGLLLGGFIGLILAVITDTTTRRRAEGDPGAVEFIDTVRAVRGEMLGRARRFSGRIRRDNR